MRKSPASPEGGIGRDRFGWAVCKGDGGWGQGGNVGKQGKYKLDNPGTYDEHLILFGLRLGRSNEAFQY